MTTYDVQIDYRVEVTDADLANLANLTSARAVRLWLLDNLRMPGYEQSSSGVAVTALLRGRACTVKDEDPSR